jgi:hypothetical protein
MPVRREFFSIFLSGGTLPTPQRALLLWVLNALSKQGCSANQGVVDIVQSHTLISFS